MTNLDQYNDLLDTQLEDLPDLKEFAPFPAGAHRVLATLELKEVADKPAIELSLELVEVEELANPEDTPPNAGDTCSALYFLDKDYGKGAVKKLFASVAPALEVTTVGELLEAFKGIECIAITSLRKNKNDPTKTYLDVVELAVI